MWSLTIRTSHQKVSEYHPKPGVTKVGRTPECEIILKDEAVSRYHAEFKFDAREKMLVIRDLDSTNGTFVNGRRIRSAVQLEHNDQVRIGQSLIAVKLADTQLLEQQENIVSLSPEHSKALLIESIENFGLLLNDLSIQLVNVSGKNEAIREIEKFVQKMIAATICRVILPEGFDDLARESVPASIVKRVIKERTPILISNIQANKKFTKSLASSRTSALIILPVIIGADLAGVIYAVQEGPVAKSFDRNDLQLVMAVSHQVALTLLRFEHQQELIHHANHDPLTNLPNRTRLLDRLEQAIARSKREEGFIFALFFLDINDFKLVNDSLGHIIGDKILQKIGTSLSEHFREVDTIARIGGDEFVILYEGLDDIEHTLNVAERLVDCFIQPFVVENRKIFVTVSVGATTSMMEYSNPEDVLRDADIAMYRAKESGGSNFQLYDSLMHKELVELMELQSSVHKAVREEELILHYQPVIALQTGRIVGFEALVRWNSPEKGLLGPERFLLHLDTTGLLNEIDLYVLGKAIDDFAELNEKHQTLAPLYVSVNISQRTFFHNQLTDFVVEMVREAGMDPKNLVFEITERANIKADETILQVMNNLRSKGIKLSLDDFGTGYSTLGYLHRFPVDYLKIDKSFVQTVGLGGENARIVETIVSMAEHIGMMVVAEGVETEEQLEFLRQINCGYAQGFYFSHPIDLEGVYQLLDQNPDWKKPEE
jgi:diguanylate cyclase (GGDEF)-like protein